MKKYIIFILIINVISIVSCKSFRKNILSSESISAYYVDGENGADNNPGTIDKPIKSIKELNLRLKKENADIYFTGGQVYDGTLELAEIKGPDTHQFKISSVGDGRAVINGGNAEAILLKKCQNIWISDIDIKGNGRKTGNKTNGLSLSNSSKCMIENVRAEGFQKSGIDLYNCSVVVLKNIVATDNGFCGINVMGSSRDLSGKIRIQDCSAENNPGDPANLDNHSGNGILVGVSDGVTIDHCSATNNGWDMPRQGNGPVGIWTWESDHVIIQYCISYRNKTAQNAKDGGGFDLDGGVTNSMIQYCLSYENQGAGYGLFQYAGASPWSNNVIRYCVSINDGQTTEGSGSFFIWNGSNDQAQLTKCLIYNNVAYNSKAPIISFENSSAHNDFIFCNNIFLSSSRPITGTNSGSTFLGNDWWDEQNKKIMIFDNLNGWANATGQEMMKGHLVGMQIDPKLRGPFLTDITDPYQLDKLTGYTLEPDSPLKNKGLDLTTYFHVIQPIRDFFGNPVPLGNGNEPGIYEMK